MRVGPTLHLLLLVLTLGAPYAGDNASADAGNCGRWHASVSMVGDGLMALNARACSTGTGPGVSFEVTCSDAQVYLRFWPDLPPTVGDYTGRTQEFLFSVDGATRQVFTVYEAIDGEFATSLEADHQLIEAMKRGLELRISDPGYELPNYHISLAGSHKALDKVIGECQ